MLPVTDVEPETLSEHIQNAIKEDPRLPAKTLTARSNKVHWILI